MYMKKFYVHEIAAVDLSKIYFLKNAKKTCKPNNSDLNCDWNISQVSYVLWIFPFETQVNFLYKISLVSIRLKNLEGK